MIEIKSTNENRGINEVQELKDAFDTLIDMTPRRINIEQIRRAFEEVLEKWRNY